MKVHKEKKGSKYVAGRLPFELIYTEECTNKSTALKKEIQIKKLSKKEKLNYILSYKSF